jgi:hypothetical protein
MILYSVFSCSWNCEIAVREAARANAWLHQQSPNPKEAADTEDQAELALTK